MVREKMCISAGKGRIICRIDPDVHESALKREGCRTVIMKGRQYRGYVYVDENALKAQSKLDYWVNLSLEYNGKPTKANFCESPAVKGRPTCRWRWRRHWPHFCYAIAGTAIALSGLLEALADFGRYSRARHPPPGRSCGSIYRCAGSFRGRYRACPHPPKVRAPAATDDRRGKDEPVRSNSPESPRFVLPTP
jgi:hypothetical protein